MKPAAKPDLVMARIYSDLRRAARWMMKSERVGHSLEATGLVNEAFVRLLSDPKVRRCDDPVQLRRIVLRLMRRVLIDWARSRKRRLEGQGGQRLPLDWLAEYAEDQKVDLGWLDEALVRLAIKDPRPAEVLTLRYFLRMSTREVSEHLKISVKTVEADVTYARAWIKRELSRQGYPALA